MRTVGLAWTKPLRWQREKVEELAQALLLPAFSMRETAPRTYYTVSLPSGHKLGKWKG